MKSFHSIVIIGCFASIGLTARAADIEPSTPTARTRAEVKAETLRAIAAGEVHLGDVSYPNELPVTAPRKPRVRATALTRPSARP